MDFGSKIARVARDPQSIIRCAERGLSDPVERRTGHKERLTWEDR